MLSWGVKLLVLDGRSACRFVVSFQSFHWGQPDRLMQGYSTPCVLRSSGLYLDAPLLHHVLFFVALEEVAIWKAVLNQHSEGILIKTQDSAAALCMSL